jgi:hypothetical protein
MQKITILSLVISLQLTGFSQTGSPGIFDNLRSNVSAFFSQEDPDFSKNTIPATWNDQSAVIIAQKSFMGFDQRTSYKLLGANKKNVYILEKERRRILLLDQSAVNTFSELYFDAGDNANGFDGKIIKPNGQTIALELEKSVAVEDEDAVPGLFKSYTFNGGASYYKVPVNNLEVGDIIDYAYLVNNDAGTYGNYIEFEPIYYSCHRHYSIVKQKFEIRLDKNTYLNSRSVNGAPEFRESTSGEYNVYQWEDGNRERIKTQYFLNQYIQMPLVKFQIVYSNTENAKNLFIGNRGELKSKLTPAELTKKASAMLNSAGSVAKSELPLNNAHLKKMDAFNSKDENYIQSCYYILRHNYALGKGRMSGAMFAALMRDLMAQKKIDLKVGVTSPNQLTRPEDIIFRNEVEWFVEVNNKLIFAPTAISHMQDIPSWAQGNKAYLIPDAKETNVKEIEIPVVSYTENVSSYTYEVSMDAANKDLLVVKAKHAHKNNNRIANSGALLHYELYEPEDWKTYGGWDDKEGLSQAQQAGLSEQISKYRAEARKMKPKFMEGQLKEDFDEVTKYDRFRLVQDGRHMRKQELMYEEDYTLGEMVLYAGKSILVKLPGFLTSQLKISGDERTRQFDAYLTTQKSFKYQIRFTVPYGFKVLGLNDLNKKVENETGSFVSEAKLENGVVILQATKIYKQNIVTKEEWPKMLEWLDAAYNFSQQKILLRQ